MSLFRTKAATARRPVFPAGLLAPLAVSSTGSPDGLCVSWTLSGSATATPPVLRFLASSSLESTPSSTSRAERFRRGLENTGAVGLFAISSALPDCTAPLFGIDTHASKSEIAVCSSSGRRGDKPAKGSSPESEGCPVRRPSATVCPGRSAASLVGKEATLSGNIAFRSKAVVAPRFP